MTPSRCPPETVGEMPEQKVQARRQTSLLNDRKPLRLSRRAMGDAACELVNHLGEVAHPASEIPVKHGQARRLERQPGHLGWHHRVPVAVGLARMDDVARPQGFGRSPIRQSDPSDEDALKHEQPDPPLPVWGRLQRHPRSGASEYRFGHGSLSGGGSSGSIEMLSKIWVGIEYVDSRPRHLAHLRRHTQP